MPESTRDAEQYVGSGVAWSQASRFACPTCGLDPEAPVKLRLLADWLDKWDDARGSENRKVQADLRRWASQWEWALNDRPGDSTEPCR